MIFCRYFLGRQQEAQQRCASTVISHYSFSIVNRFVLQKRIFGIFTG